MAQNCVWRVGPYADCTQTELHGVTHGIHHGIQAHIVIHRIGIEIRHDSIKLTLLSFSFLSVYIVRIKIYFKRGSHKTGSRQELLLWCNSSVLLKLPYVQSCKIIKSNFRSHVLYNCNPVVTDYRSRGLSETVNFSIDLFE